MTAVTVTYVASTSVDVTVTEPTIEVTVALSGAAGPANTLTIGTVSTLAPGASATASVTGTPPAQTLNLGIPTGATGAASTVPGPTGPQGDWSTAQALNPQTGTAYTLRLSDAGKLVTFSSEGTGSPATVTVTVPTGILTVGQRIDLAQLGTGQVLVSPGTGVTINSTPTAKLRTAFSAATLICTATTATPTATYLLLGDLAAV